MLQVRTHEIQTLDQQHEDTLNKQKQWSKYVFESNYKWRIFLFGSHSLRTFFKYHLF